MACMPIVWLVLILAVVHRVLQTWRLNDASKGGLSSFNLIILVMGYLMGPRRTTQPDQDQAPFAVCSEYLSRNLCEHLQGLFQMYGRAFDYKRDAVDLHKVRYVCRHLDLCLAGSSMLWALR